MEYQNEINEMLINHYDKDCIISEIVRLGGLTNKTFKVATNKGTIIVRLPGPGTEELISRKEEKISNMLACELGIDPGIIYFDDTTGDKISNYVEDAITMSPETLKEEKHLIQVAQILNKLHKCNVNTNIIFDVFGMAKDYEDFMVNNKVSLFKNYAMYKEQVYLIKEKLNRYNQKLVPCHNDPLCENWISGNGSMYLIDWEYAGMNDAMWDIADVSIEAMLNEKEDLLLLENYFGRNITIDEKISFLANKIYLDYLWSLWGKTRVPFDDTMEDYANERFERMKTNIKKIEVLL
ncbi:MAG: phosphotransferase [Erysipelotrichaceae bacterium]